MISEEYRNDVLREIENSEQAITELEVQKHTIDYNIYNLERKIRALKTLLMEDTNNE